jgi:hypothetical protein
MTSMVKIDRSLLPTKDRDIEVNLRLEEFLAQVQLIKPLISFVACDKGSYIQTIHENNANNDGYDTKKVIIGVKAFEDGEEIGGLFVGTRHYNGRHDTYEVSSFRINKMRGDENTTSTTNIKVALRKIKKLFIGKADQELIDEIKHRVSNKVSNLHGECRNEVRWSFDDDEEGLNYALLAHLSRCKGDSTVSLPVMPSTVKDQKRHTDACAGYYETKELVDLLNADKGYGAILRPDNAYIVYNYATQTLARYKDFTAMPTDLQTKLGVFKLLKSGEVCQFGVMFKPESYEVEKYPNTYFYIKE